MDETEIRRLLDERQYRTAFERVVTAFRDRIHRLAFGMTRDQALAQDLAQEILLRVWKALPRYDGRASLSTWIYTISRNACLTELQRRSTRPTLSLDSPDALDLLDRNLVQPPPVASGASADVHAFLARLPERERRVLVMFYLEQKSHVETAAALGMPIGTVKVLLHRAKRRLATFAP